MVTTVVGNKLIASEVSWCMRVAFPASVMRFVAWAVYRGLLCVCECVMMNWCCVSSPVASASDGWTYWLAGRVDMIHTSCTTAVWTHTHTPLPFHLNYYFFRPFLATHLAHTHTHIFHTHTHTQIDRAYYGQSNASILFAEDGESPEKGAGEEESSYALMTRLTKFIYNASDVPDIGRWVWSVTRHRW